MQNYSFFFFFLGKTIWIYSGSNKKANLKRLSADCADNGGVKVSNHDWALRRWCRLSVNLNPNSLYFQNSRPKFL